MADSPTEPLLAGLPEKGRAGLAGRLLTACTLNGRLNYSRQKAPRQHGEKDTDHADRPNFLSRGLDPVVGVFSRFKQELSYAALPAKAGLAAALCSILCFIPGPLSVLNKNGMWAVVTADVVLEANVGLTFSKGINRTLGTLAAAVLALIVNYAAPLCGIYEPYFVTLWVFFGAGLATMFKFRRPFKDRWNYAVAMSMITFHILILSKSEYKDKIRLPLIRLVTIVIGFLTASLVNLSVAPKYAGSTINELVAKNFERAGNVMERCVTAYCEGTMLEQVPDILAGKYEDDNIHVSFHEIVSADSEVDKLMKAVPFEPCHGKFFFGYPWDMYEDITDNLRYTLYDVVALDSCLRAEIQAPLHIRQIFEEEFQCIGKECARVFRVLGESIRAMCHVQSLGAMQCAEEGALLLQHKIAKYSATLLGSSVSDDLDVGLGGRKEKEAKEDNISISFQDAFRKFSNYHYLDSQPRSDGKSNDSVNSNAKSHLVDGHEDFLQRRDSLGHNWDSIVKRVSALSLIKFSSLLIELVAKAKYVVNLVDELGVKACFEEVTEGGTPKSACRHV